MSAGQVISRKSTRLYKLAIWASAAGMVVLVTAINSQRNGHQMAARDVIPGIILAGFWIYFLRKSQVPMVADEVVNCGDHLEVRRGKTQAAVPFSNIAGAQASVIFGIPGVKIDLVEPVHLGRQIVFWTQSKSVAETYRVAKDISERAMKAREGLKDVARGAVP